MNCNVKTDIGTFRVKIEDDFDVNFETRKQIQTGYRVGIGGNKDTCVFLTVKNGCNIGTLHNLRIRGLMCETTGIHMMNLFFTIIKEKLPFIKYIDLDDDSEFPCKINTTTTYGVSLALYELAFHQSTWYERHFGAELSNAVLKSLYIKDGFFVKKPVVYDFKHPDLNKELKPFYEKTNTWKEFFDLLYVTYKEKCKLLLPWYKDAVRSIMGNTSFANQSWRIDLSNPKLKKISYEIVKTGGSYNKKTRKSKKINYLDYAYHYFDIDTLHYDERDFDKL